MRISTLQLNSSSISRMSDLQTAITKAQTQLSSGQRITQISDDPIGSERVIQLDSEISASTQYNKNADTANQKLGFEESQLQSVTNILQRANELATQAGNTGSNDATSNKAIATELDQLNQQLVQLANSQDTTGQYVFSGFNSTQAAVSQDSANRYVYGGDSGQRYLEITHGLTVATNDSGDHLFFDLPVAANSYTTLQGSTNTGTGKIEAQKLSDSTAWQSADPKGYTIRFNPLNPGRNYDVIANSTGAVVPGFQNHAYTPGETITVQGVDLNLSGNPEPGDSFVLKPTTKQDIFTSIKKLSDALKNGSNTTSTSFVVQSSLTNIQNALERVSEVTTEVGTRMNKVQNATNQNSDFITVAQENRSKIADVDYAATISDLSTLTNSLQISYQTFAKIKQMSLFQYLQ